MAHPMANVELPPSLAFCGLQRPFNSPQMRFNMDDQEHLFSNDSAPSRPGEEFDTSKVRFSGRLPGWLWGILAAVLGIDSGKRKLRLIVATTLNLLTLMSALLFACCGLVFNVYDIMSEMTKTTVLLGICKSLLGAYWVGLGIYSHSLAARLFSNVRFVDCIRLHSKTIFKINTAAIIVLLSLSIIVANIHWNRHLLVQFEEPVAPNTTRVKDANCVTAGVDPVLCEVYFIARVIHSAFNLLWNLLVASMLLSVCRTHTICIRRFMKELLHDTKIYEEFLMLQALGPQATLIEDSIDPNERSKNLSTIMESNIWDDDMNEMDEDASSDNGGPPDNAHILQGMRSLRYSTSYDRHSVSYDASASPVFFSRAQRFSTSQRLDNPRAQASPPPWSDHDNFSQGFRQNSVNDDPPEDHSLPQGSNHFHFNPPPTQATAATTATTVTMTPTAGTNQQSGDTTRRRFSSSASSGGYAINHAQPQRYSSALEADEDFYRKALEEGRPPILSNADLYFTHFQLVRRLCSTSRLLQRWMMTWISFILMWCALLIIYWTSHSPSWIGLFEFIGPLIILYLITSAYAEVNFEGERLKNFVLPTEERMSVLYYMCQTPLALKVFSFNVSYNAIMTVVAGVALTFATRIVLDQIIT